MKNTVVLILLLLFSVNYCLASTQLVQETEIKDFLQEKSFWDEVEFLSTEFKAINTFPFEFALVGRISLVKWRNIRVVSGKVKLFVNWVKMKAAGEVCLELITVSFKDADIIPVAWCGEIAIGLDFDINFGWNTRIFGFSFGDLRSALNIYEKAKMWWMQSDLLLVKALAIGK